MGEKEIGRNKEPKRIRLVQNILAPNPQSGAVATAAAAATSARRGAVAMAAAAAAPAGASGERMNEKIDECNRKENRRKMRKGESDFDFRGHLWYG